MMFRVASPARTRSRSTMLTVLLCLALLLRAAQASANFDDRAFSTPLSSLFDGGRVLAAKDGSDRSKAEEECTEAEKCQMCTFSDQKSIPACKQTGRMQKFRCVVSSEDGELVEKRTEIRSCKRTEADEEFGMVRLQMLCLVIGSLAFASVRRQKRLSASLFDQRKQGLATPQQPKPQRGRRGSDLEEEEGIEFSTMTNQETVPLVDSSSNPLEVI